MTVVFLWVFKDKHPKRNRGVITFKSSIKNNPYSLHVAAGKKLLGKPFNDSDAITKALDERKVRRVKNKKGFIVDKLTHSQPYLHTKAADLLEAIGESYSKKVKGNFVVTSLTRPIESQKKLAKTNVNASPNTSSHSYGVSIDISYSKFNKDLLYSYESHKALEEVLSKFQSESRLLVIREKVSTCYHITVKP